MALTFTHADAQAPTVDGTLGAVGSDTMAGLVLRWGEALKQRHPDVKIQFQAAGSANAPPALIAGTTRLGPMSRQLTPDEIQAFTNRYGYPPLELKVARDALAVIVHRHNPLDALSQRQVDAIFSTSRACGANASITRWDTILDQADWPFYHIALHGRNTASGTHDLFQQRALCGGEFRRNVSEHPGTAPVVAAVGESPGAMGYAGYSHLNALVKALRIEDGDGNTIAPSEGAVQTGAYPLSRYLYLYVNAPPNVPLPPAERALLALIFSPEGQKIVRAAGFVPLSETVRQQQARW
ncbi:PstS family phosphate ABC transporter substrate-binding protein [Halomonas vilamensis]|uniref:PstS family phosphate ABC transporter substrate-binding protein n=1 Tax=Vreelandella vilamensis TaxID=531309 RepID=A0ABU1H6V3_9GAMM|nr:PstS family phosphate ABC transporter substrate-binding protein [Halomonas vilamensis]